MNTGSNIRTAIKFLNHFGHNGGMTYKQIAAWGAERGLLAAYDGMKIEF